MIKDFTPRLYQETILASAARYNTLIVLPTGLGKTNIFLMIAAQRLMQHPGSKILLIGPTRPLIDQYLSVFQKHFDIAEDKMCVLTGMVKPHKRVELWEKSTIIFSTPQGLENDLISGKVSLRDVSLLGFDEAHRATGDYSYVWIAKKYYQEARWGRIVGMTASPGSDSETITEVCTNLYVEEIEVRTEQDDDVKPYIQEVDVDYVAVTLPDEFYAIKRELEGCIASKIAELKKLGYVRGNFRHSKSELLRIQALLHSRMGRGDKPFTLLKSVSLLAEVMKASHALELLETQGIVQLQSYLRKLQEEGAVTKTKALKNLLADEQFKAAIIRTNSLYEQQIEHPKLTELKRIVKHENATKLIIFSQYRDTAVKIKEELDSIKVASEIFVGQTKKKETGLSQKEQKAMLERFRNDEFRVLIATSIGEEGLDIVNVGVVMFYEPIPSAIRTIQRRGRTGRHERGRVIILMTKDTRDEAFKYVAQNKEARMHRVLNDLKHTIKLEKRSGLMKYIEEKSPLKIFADYREKGPIAKELSEQGIDVELRTLEIGDYLVSSRVAIEVKAVDDFVNSIIDGRLLSQAKALRQHYEKPLLIIQGDQDIYGMRGVHPNAIRGMIATIAVDFGISILRTRDEKDTAAMLITLAKREQEKRGEEIQLHTQKPLTTKELQEFIVASLPGVDSKIAPLLLKHFGAVEKVFTASAEELQEVEMIGPKKAAEIRRILESAYQQLQSATEKP